MWRAVVLIIPVCIKELPYSSQRFPFHYFSYRKLNITKDTILHYGARTISSEDNERRTKAALL